MEDVNDGAPPKGRVPALERGLRLLEALAAADGPRTGAELCRSTGLPRTSVHDLLHTLVSSDYVREVDPQRHAYRLGPRVLALSHSYLAGLDFADEADRVVRALSARTGETVQAAVLHGSEALYIAKAESRNVLRLVSAVGKRLPAHLTGVGKALLAHLPAEEVGLLFEDPDHLPTMTVHSIDTLERLKQELATIRRTGLAFDYCESNPDVACVAAPVMDSEHRAAAAISISFPLARWSEDYRDELSSQVLVASRRLSETLGAVYP